RFGSLRMRAMWLLTASLPTRNFSPSSTKSAPIWTGAVVKPWPQVRFHGPTRNTISSIAFATSTRRTRPFPKSMWTTKVALPTSFVQIPNPKLLDVAEQFCGPEIIASSVYRLRPKVPSHSWSPVPWHQDSAYFEAYCDLALVMTVWVPLVDATEERGCLWVMPGMHKGGLFFHQHDDIAHYLVIPDEEFGGSKAVPAPVPKGGVLLLNNRTPHA